MSVIVWSFQFQHFIILSLYTMCFEDIYKKICHAFPHNKMKTKFSNLQLETDGSVMQYEHHCPN